MLARCSTKIARPPCTPPCMHVAMSLSPAPSHPRLPGTRVSIPLARPIMACAPNSCKDSDGCNQQWHQHSSLQQQQQQYHHHADEVAASDDGEEQHQQHMVAHSRDSREYDQQHQHQQHQQHQQQQQQQQQQAAPTTHPDTDSAYMGTTAAGHLDYAPGISLAYEHMPPQQLQHGMCQGPCKVAIMLCNGLKSSRHGSKSVALEQLAAQQGAEFVRFDYRGHFESSGVFLDLGICDWIQDSLAILDRVVASDKVLVLGSSIGAWVALHLARMRPQRVVGLLLVAPAIDISHLRWSGLTPAQQLEAVARGTLDLDSPYLPPGEGCVGLEYFRQGHRCLLLHHPAEVAEAYRLLLLQPEPCGGGLREDGSSCKEVQYQPGSQQLPPARGTSSSEGSQREVQTAQEAQVAQPSLPGWPALQTALVGAGRQPVSTKELTPQEVSLAAAAAAAAAQPTDCCQVQHATVGPSLAEPGDLPTGAKEWGLHQLMASLEVTIVHGSEDEVVPLSILTGLLTRLEQVGLQLAVHVVEGADHRLSGPAELELLRQCVLRLWRRLSVR